MKRPPIAWTDSEMEALRNAVRDVDGDTVAVLARSYGARKMDAMAATMKPAERDMIEHLRSEHVLNTLRKEGPLLIGISLGVLTLVALTIRAMH